jgi:hypothetical protein
MSGIARARPQERKEVSIGDLLSLEIKKAAHLNETSPCGILSTEKDSLNCVALYARYG